MSDRLHRFVTKVALLLGVLCLLPLAAAAEGRRVALVVSNAAYATLPALDAPLLDGQAMGAALSGLGFEVTVLPDATTDAFQQALTQVSAGLDAGDTALFYYGGHAIRQDGAERLVPVAASLADPAVIGAETWALQDVVDAFKANDATLLMFIDATQKNPLPAELRPAEDGDGAAHLRGGANSYVALAAAPGTVDWNKVEPGSFSPFTAALLANIAAKGLTLPEVMVKVSADVKAATGSDQIPWQQSSLRKPFYFTQPDVTAAAPAFELAAEEVTLISAPPAAGRAIFAQTARLPDDLPRAVQQELKRIGCYGNVVDGDWGRGSRAAMDAYYEGKKQPEGEVEPTEKVYRTLLSETDTVCVVEAVAPKPAAPKPAANSGTKKPAASKPAASKPATAKPKAAAKPAAPAAPAAKPGVKCKFYGIAVICK